MTMRFKIINFLGPIILFLFFCVGGVTPCNANALKNENTEINLVKIKPTFEGDCSEWNRTYSLLSFKGKENIEKYGIAINGQDSSVSRGYYVLSQKLIDDCPSRVKIGQFIELVIGGQDSGDQRNFAEQNSEQIVKVLRNIWDAPSFSSDGTAHEKYLLLTYDSINEQHISSFISDLLKTKKLNSELLYVLLNRKLMSLKPVIIANLKESEDKKDIIQQLLYLIILQKIDSNSEYINNFERISQRSAFSKETKIKLKKLNIKMKLNKDISFEDIDELNLLQDG